MSFECQRTVQFYETDLMGVVHHSNYYRFFEEARLAWMTEADLLKEHAPHTDLVFAVLESNCRHLRPVTFGQKVLTRVQLKKEGRTKLRFQYALYEESKEEKNLLATGQTLHIAVNGKGKVSRIPERVLQKLESETWTETWP